MQRRPKINQAKSESTSWMTWGSCSFVPSLGKGAADMTISGTVSN